MPIRQHPSTKPEKSEAGRIESWSLVAAVNNDRVFENTLLSSPGIDAKCQIIPKRGFQCAGKAYNSGINDARHDIIVFAHQDIYLPHDWKAQVEVALSQVARIDPGWGVLGVVGVAKENQDIRGHCYSTGLQRFVGETFSTPVEVRSLDEIVLLLRRSSGLMFDENLPGFHLYGTDICAQANARGMKSYVVPAFCIHNSNGVKYYPVEFWRAYFYLRRKWWPRLPLTTCCTKITKWCLPALKSMFRDCVDTLFRLRSVGSRVDDVATLYRSLFVNP
ncbi:MAG: glycosyltransferase [Terriglobales bacterium]